jgi:hypothetical protein
MQPSVEGVVNMANQPLLSDTTTQEYFLENVGSVLGDSVKCPVDLSTALVSYKDLLSLKIPERPRYLPWLPEGGNVVASPARRRDRRDPVKILGGSKKQDIVLAYTRDNSYFAHHLYQGESQWLCRSRPTVFHGLLIFLHLTITRILSVSHWQPCIFTTSWL